MSTNGRLVLLPVAGRRRGRLAVAGWLAVLVAVVTWVLAAGIGTAPRDGRPVAGAVAGGTPSGAGSIPATVAPTPHGSGLTEVIGGRPLSGTVWFRAGNGARSFDLSTGEAGWAVDTGNWRDRILRLPDGRFLCVCVDVAPTNGGERATVRLKNIVDGKPTTSTELVTLEGRRDESLPADDPGSSVETSASLSPDGSLLAVGLAVRKPPVWERSLRIVALPSREVVQVFELDPVPADRRVLAYAPRLQFSRGGERALVSLTVFEANVLVDERHFAAWIHGHLLGLEPVPGFGIKGDLADGRCSDTWPELAGYESLFGICRDGNGKAWVLRSVAIATGRITDLDLGPALEGFWPMRLVDGGTLFLWDPFSHRVARVDVPSGRLEASAVIVTPTAALQPLDHLARSFSAWIAPRALAKVMLEPGLALSSDGETLYVVAMSGDGIVAPGRASTIHVLDADTLAVRATWSIEPDVVSIAVAPSGDVLVGSLASAPDGVEPNGSLTVLDADTGSVRARYDGLETGWPQLIEPSALNR